MKMTMRSRDRFTAFVAARGSAVLLATASSAGKVSFASLIFQARRSQSRGYYLRLIAGSYFSADGKQLVCSTRWRFHCR